MASTCDEDSPQEHVQAIRSVDKSIPLNAVPSATPDEIYHVDTHPDPETKKEIVLWDDILLAFKNAELVRHKTRVVPFLKGKDFTILQPRRIAAMPEAILDVVVDTPGTDNERFASHQIQQQDPILLSLPTYESTMKVDVGSSWDVPTTFMSSSTTPRPDNDIRSQLQRLHITATKVPVTMDVVQISISASLGDKKAQVAVGDMYKDGKGVPQDYQAAMNWYLKAVEQGDAVGQQRVGSLYSEGFGVPQNYSTAMNWYLKAVEQGYPAAQHGIGFLYHYGRGVPQDYTQAMEWYLKATDQGYAKSQFNIGILYDKGQGVLQDSAQAITWFHKAANQGHADAQYNVGFFYDQGQGVPQVYTKAAEWYSKAAQQGDDGGKRKVEVLRKKGVAVN